MPKHRRVRLLNRQRRLRVDSSQIRVLLEVLLEDEGIDPDVGVEVLLVRDSVMTALNARFRNRPVPTDVLAFPTDSSGWPADEPPVLGSVVVSVDRAEAQAAERGLPVREEIQRLVAHGALHLVGYRDGSRRERARMRRRENRYLARAHKAKGGDRTSR